MQNYACGVADKVLSQHPGLSGNLIGVTPVYACTEAIQEHRYTHGAAGEEVLTFRRSNVVAEPARKAQEHGTDKARRIIAPRVVVVN